MTPGELRTQIESFLGLVEQGGEIASLVRALDQLALARAEIADLSDDDMDGDPETRSYNDWADLVRKHSPTLGYYNVVIPVVPAGDNAELAVGDAVDDLADIAHDLDRVAWRFKNTSEADAVWHFRFDFDSHWGEHLRDLQVFLYASKGGA